MSAIALLVLGTACTVLPIGTMLHPEPNAKDRWGTVRQQQWICYLQSLYSRRKHHGLLYCAGFDALSTLKYQLAIAFVFVFGAGAGLLLLVIMAAVTLAVLVIRGLLLLNSRASGVICLAVALVVTACSTWALSDYLSGALLWLIAIGTGCLAGSATVVVREFVTRAVPYASDRVHTFARQTVASRVEPLTNLWLKPEQVAWCIAITPPEA